MVKVAIKSEKLSTFGGKFDSKLLIIFLKRETSISATWMPSKRAQKENSSIVSFG